MILSLLLHFYGFAFATESSLVTFENNQIVSIPNPGTQTVLSTNLETNGISVSIISNDTTTIINPDGTYAHLQKDGATINSIVKPESKKYDYDVNIFSKVVCNTDLANHFLSDILHSSKDFNLSIFKEAFNQYFIDSSCDKNETIDSLYRKNSQKKGLSCLLSSSGRTHLDLFGTFFLFPKAFEPTKIKCDGNGISIIGSSDKPAIIIDPPSTTNIIFELYKTKNFSTGTAADLEEAKNKIASCFNDESTAKSIGAFANQADNEKQSAERSNQKNPEVRQINLANVKVDPKDIEKIQKEARAAVVQAKLGNPVSTPPTLLKLQNYFSSVVRQAVSQETSGASQSQVSNRTPANTSPSAKNVPRPSVDNQMQAGSTRGDYILGAKARDKIVINKPATPEGEAARKPDTAQNSGDQNPASDSRKTMAGSDSAMASGVTPGIAGGTGPNSKISNTAAAATAASPKAASRAPASVKEKAILSEIQKNISSILNKDPDYIRSVNKKLSDVDTQVRINGMLLGSGSKFYVYKNGQFIPR